MDFFTHQDKARRNTFWLIIYFVITVILIIVTLYLGLVLISSIAAKDPKSRLDFFEFHPEVLLTSTLFVLITVGLGSLYKTVQLSGDGSAVALALGGVQVQPNTRDLEERILLNVVEEMAIASGTPVPPVYVMNEEQGINAFAAGTKPQNAVIGVTRGCLQTLTRDELQGVIAHEFSHILNGDMRLNVRLIGLLHGILLIAMIGYTLFRFASRMPIRTSNKDDSKGAVGLVVALFATGAVLLGIGYTGVFFAGLIQAAVSRQREFLADASAVQFTRNTTGITGALKRIGGWKKRSMLKSVFAKEASHMFFGQGVSSQWFATHPALEVRIQRLEPGFKGNFETTSIAHHSEADIVDPRTLGFQQRKSSPSKAPEKSTVHAAAIAGVQHFESHPHDAVEHIGNPEDEHIDHANRILGEIPPKLFEEIHEPFGAMAIIYALLVAPKSDPTRNRQLELIDENAPKGLAKHTLSLLPYTDSLHPEQRLPLACMAVPALDLLSDPQTGAFRTLARQLIDADRRWTIFEFALQRYITKRVVLRKSEPIEVDASAEKLSKSFAQVLSSLAHLGANVHADQAYAAGWTTYAQGQKIRSDAMPAMLERDACTLKQLDIALDTLAAANHRQKRNFLNAFSDCIVYDQRSTINEVELLRVISDALGCPMPPVLDVAPIAS